MRATTVVRAVGTAAREGSRTTGRDLVVVGSINLDILLFQDRLPLRGETYTARSVEEAFGGKGANQAVQCAKLGQRVQFVGAVGHDTRGRDCRANLEQHGVHCWVAEVDHPTGLGVNNILGRGELHATIVPGANAAVSPEWVQHNDVVFDAASFLVIQNEIPLEANLEAVRRARQTGARVVYNAAPADLSTAALLKQCDYLIVNEEEAKTYLGDDEPSVPGDLGVDERREVLLRLKRFCPRVIVTLGAAGSLASFDGEVHHVAAVPVVPVDTTGAGDAFVGAFTSALNTGVAELEAATIASAVAAQATLGIGAQTAMAGTWVAA